MSGAFIKVIIVCFLIVNLTFAETITVDDDEPADFTMIQDAVDYSADGDVIVVQPGTYFEFLSFGGKAITLTGSDPYDPNIVSVTIIRPLFQDLLRSVIFEWGEGPDSVLKGFTITERGIYCKDSSPTISHNIIEFCEANENGGAILGENASPTIQYNIIRNNRARMDVLITPPLVNTLRWGGGGIASCDGLISHNIIENNVVDLEVIGNLEIDEEMISSCGGGLFNCNGTIKNNTILNNAVIGTFIIGSDNPWTFDVSGLGGGIGKCNAVITQNVIAYNFATKGGGIYGESVSSSYNLFYQNFGGSFHEASPGENDFMDNPRFVSVGYSPGDDFPPYNQSNYLKGDYHLKSEAGHWDASTESWVIDNITSPAIDAGDPNEIIDREPNPNGGIINLGAYGNTPEASKSLNGDGTEPIPKCINPPEMDTNHDCKVDMSDFSEFALQWMTCGLDIQVFCWE